MSKLKFSIEIPCQIDKLIEKTTDYENYPSLLPHNIESVKIKETNPTGIITEEIFIFSTIVKNKIIQESLHNKISKNEFSTEILSGPAKGTIIKTNYEEVNSGTKVTMDIDLKLSLKAKILLPVVKHYYKTFFKSLLYKINNQIEGNV